MVVPALGTRHHTRLWEADTVNNSLFTSDSFAKLQLITVTIELHQQNPHLLIYYVNGKDFKLWRHYQALLLISYWNLYGSPISMFNWVILQNLFFMVSTKQGSSRSLMSGFNKSRQLPDFMQRAIGVCMSIFISLRFYIFCFVYRRGFKLCVNKCDNLGKISKFAENDGKMVSRS